MSQEELEAHDGVAEGKYTVGLGQRCMAFCGDQEDVVSMSLTAVHALLEKYDVDPRSIGRQGGKTSCPVQRDQRLCVLYSLMAGEHRARDDCLVSLAVALLLAACMHGVLV